MPKGKALAKISVLYILLIAGITLKFNYVTLLLLAWDSEKILLYNNPVYDTYPVCIFSTVIFHVS